MWSDASTLPNVGEFRIRTTTQGHDELDGESMCDFRDSICPNNESRQIMNTFLFPKLNYFIIIHC